MISCTELARLTEQPGTFVDAAFGATPWWRQSQILQAATKSRRVAVPSAVDTGKTTAVAWLALWAHLRYPHSEVYVLSASWQQVKEIVWKEIHLWLQRCRIPDLFPPAMTTRMERTKDWFIAGASPRDPGKLRGRRSQVRTLLILDEAPGIDPRIWDAVEGLLTNDLASLIVLGNPIEPIGPFYDACERNEARLYRHVRISAPEAADAGVEKKIPGLCTHAWIEERRAVWGEASPLFQALVLGRFPESAEDAPIRLWQVQACCGLDKQPSDPAIIGVDVAMHGKDESVWYRLAGEKLTHRHILKGNSAPELIALTHQFFRQWAPVELIVVDADGLGAPIYEQLAVQGLPVFGFRNGAPPLRHADRPTWQREHANLAAEAFDEMARRIHEQQLEVNNPDGTEDAELHHQLVTRRWQFLADGRKRLEPKDELAKRGEHSPDRADALMMAIFGQRLLTDAQARKAATSRERERTASLRRYVDEMAYGAF